jgi:hypothetical protein
VEYFAPKSFATGKLELTQNTRSIHHYNASWLKPPTRFYLNVRDISIKLFGARLGKTIVIPLLIVAVLLTEGFSGLVQKINSFFKNK